MKQPHTLPDPVPAGIHVSTALRNAGFAMLDSHCHNQVEVFHVETGSCRFLLDEEIYDMHAGDFLLIPPMKLHYTRYLFGTCRRTALYFSPTDADDTVLDLLPDGRSFLEKVRVFQIPEGHMEQVHDCLGRLLKESRMRDSYSPPMQRLCLQELLLLFGRLATFLGDAPLDIHTTDQQIIRAARFISDSYMHPITSRDVANAVGFSPNYLSRKFHEAAGIGLHEYLVFIRLHHAALELRSTRDSITTIAFRCGFSDSNYFKDAFKKKYGVTPSYYRKYA